MADGRYDYLETGSLISLRMNVEDIVIPSEEEHVEMFPMDFEEFLWALGDETTVPYLRECFEVLRPLGQAMHKRVMNDFRQYILVGGMPQALKTIGLLGFTVPFLCAKRKITRNLSFAKFRCERGASGS